MSLSTLSHLQTEHHELPEGLREQLAAALHRQAAQQPNWPDLDQARAVSSLLREMPPLTPPEESRRLRTELSQVAQGRAIVLQGGDCAETFAANTEQHVHGNVELLLRMAATLADGAGLPVVKIGRIAGQYAKPRSESIDALGLPVYRGDIVNSALPTPQDRAADPDRMIEAYLNARATLDMVRAFTRRQSTTLYTSHEALLLDYESPLLRAVSERQAVRLYASSAHFVWVGERTRHLEGAHIALASLLANPIGIKIGPGTTPEQVAEYVERLDPDGEPGRLTLISRMGASRVRDILGPVVERVARTGHQVVWLCDPMHGNTQQSTVGYKTRRLEAIVEEIVGFFEVHRALGTHPGGLHLELTGDPVTECLGGGGGTISDHSLAGRYESTCDPRLNPEQSMELAELCAELYRD
jgi:3-deoxy-7-phosphoheptulonate synthase